MFYFDLSNITGWEGGGRLLNEEESVHLPCMAVGGFFFGPLSFLFVSYIFSYRPRKVVTHISEALQDTVPEACGEEEPLGRDGQSFKG